MAGVCGEERAGERRAVINRAAAAPFSVSRLLL